MRIHWFNDWQSAKAFADFHKVDKIKEQVRRAARGRYFSRFGVELPMIVDPYNPENTEQERNAS